LGGLTVIEIGNGSRSESATGNDKRTQTRAQRSYLHGYGIPENDVSAGLIVIRGEGYYRSDLDFFARLPSYDEELLRQVLRGMHKERHMRFPRGFLGDALEFENLDDLGLSTILSPPTPEAEQEIAQHWTRHGLKSSYLNNLKRVKGPVLERYVQNLLAESMRREGVCYPMYRNVFLPRPDNFRSPDDRSKMREVDIIIAAPFEATDAIIRNLPDLYGATLDVSPVWRERCARETL
jgi:hypothetical protein